MEKVASQFSVCRKTITTLWNLSKSQRLASIPVDVRSKKMGCKRKGSAQLDEEKLKSIELLKRSTQHGVAENLGVSQSTVSRWVMSKQIRGHTNALKPGLTDKNKLARLIFSLQHLQCHEITKQVIFKDQSNIIHLDEKWFSKTKPTTRFYLAKGETEPHRCVQSKSFIEKVMFMCAVARPQYGSNGEVVFDGKIGIWPFVCQVPAQRNSKNRVAGTLETKCIESINKHVTREMIINQVLPAIKSKWPSNLSKRIIIQQDNARPHFSNDDPEFKKHATADGWQIELAYQTSNSPDLNVLDLGFFRSIQSLQQKKSTQAYMLEIMKKKGGIDYPIPHMHKSKLANAGLLPEYLSANIEMVKDCIQYVQNVGDAGSISSLVNELLSLTESSGDIASTSGTSYDPTEDNVPVGHITANGDGSNDPTGNNTPVGHITE
ncbi:uncharacterized protein LOC141630865 [Silene latifolia]|uniref:uncharacterized protein LOC141630865 n=1 Tax=Silene latifolia TaxID=37657 RepID=UPI003D77D0B3